MNIPKQVMEAGKKADEALKAMQIEAEKAKEVKPIKVEEPKPVELSLPEQQEIKEEQVINSEDKTLEQDTPVTQLPSSKEGGLVFAKGKENDPDYLRSRANTINGLYQKEKKAREDERKLFDAKFAEMNERIQQQTGKIDLLLSSKNSVKEEVAIPQKLNEEELLTYFSKDNIETFGEDALNDILNATSNKSKKEIRDELKKMIDERFDELRGGIKEVEVETKTNRYWDEVERLAPGAKKLNRENSDSLTLWLEEKVPFTKYTRKQIAEDAIAKGDVELVAEYFNAYKSEMGYDDDSAGHKKKKKDIVVEPNSAAVSQPDDDSNKPIYTQTQVDDFYKSLRMRTFSGTADQAGQIEKQIEEAYKEGRVKR